jgi:WD40 repeat protein
VASIVVLLTIAAACAFVLWNRIEVAKQAQQFVAAGEADHQRKAAEVESALRAQTHAQPETLERPREIVLSGHVGRIAAMAFSPDGKSLISAGSDGRTIFWSLGDQSILHTISDHRGSVARAAISGDAGVVASAAHNGQIVISAITSGKTIGTIEPVCAAMLALAIDRTGSRIACACADLTLRVLESGGESAVTLRGTTGAFTSCAFSADGKYLAAGSQRSSIYVWPTSQDAAAVPPRRLDGLSGETTAVTFLKSDSRIAAVDASGQGRVWTLDDTADDTSTLEFRPATDRLVDAAFSFDGRVLACLNSDGVTLWNVDSSPPDPMAGPLAITETATTIAVDSDGSHIALGMLNGDIRVVPAPK